MPSDPASTIVPSALREVTQFVRARVLARFLRLAPNERNRLYLLTLVIGGVCGLTAVGFHLAIRAASHALIETALTRPGSAWMLWAIITPTAGALVAGVLLHYVLPNARGSGVPQVKLVYAVKSGRLRLRDAVGKFAVATVQLGTGSALGREGPTVQICSTVASALGRLFAISPRNLRRLIPVGAAAGIAAAFNAPIAAVTFTIEEVVGDLDQTVLAGVVVAAALAAAVEHSILGAHPVFDVPGNYQLDHASSLLTYGLLGCAAAVLAHVFYALLLSLRARVSRLQGPVRAVAPAIGGLVAGVVAVIAIVSIDAHGVLGDGYAALSSALVGAVPLKVMLVLVVAKLIATSACYASGGAGGIFAPVLFMGGMLGGAFGHLDAALLHHGGSELGAFALVGMGAFFAAVIRAPITSVLIIFEMTRGYGLILPLMIANTVAYMLARSWRPVPIYEALLEQDGMHLPHTQRAAAALTSFQVADAMTTELVVVSVHDTVATALQRVERLGHSVYPVVDAGVLRGLVSEARLRRHAAEGRNDDALATLARNEDVLTMDQPLVDAIARMSELGARQMAVVDGPSKRLVGMLAMSDVMRAHAAASGTAHVRDTAAGPSSKRAPVTSRPRDTSVPIPRGTANAHDAPPTVATPTQNQAGTKPPPR